MKFLSAIIATFLFIAGVADAASYYVSKTGSDTNSGAQASPWLTVAHAAAVASAGDTVTINPGTYSEDVTLSKSGTSTARITFTGSGLVQSFSVSGNYITITHVSVGDGSTVNNSTSTAINCTGSHILVDTVTMNLQSPGTPAASASTAWQSSGANNTVQNCDISHTAGGFAAIVMTGTSTNNLAFNNKIHDILDGDALNIWGVNNIIRGNEVYALTGPNYGKPGVDHPDFLQTYGPPSGGGDAPANNIIVENNYVHDCDAQIGNLDNPDSTFHDWTWRNNIFSNVQNSPIRRNTESEFLQQRIL